jgi:hypothetical protein
MYSIQFIFVIPKILCYMNLLYMQYEFQRPWPFWNYVELRSLVLKMENDFVDQINIVETPCTITGYQPFQSG